jgi:hypothetical protein
MVNSWSGDQPAWDFGRAFALPVLYSVFRSLRRMDCRPVVARQSRKSAMADRVDRKKLIYLLVKWGWRGPAVLALVIFGIWLFSKLFD